MKNSIFFSTVFFVLTTLSSPLCLSAQEYSLVDATPTSLHTGAVAPKTPKYQYDEKAGSHAPIFKDFGEYVSNHLSYPELAKANSIEGRVEVLITISDEGKVLNAKIRKSLGFGCDEAALAFVRNMPDWAPAMNYGIPVKGRVIVALDFKLQ